MRSLGLVAALAILFGVAPQYLRAQNPQAAIAPDPLLSAQQQADCLGSGAGRTSRQSGTGVVRFIGTDVGRPISHPRPQEASISVEDAARAYLMLCGSLFGPTEGSELVVARTETGGLRATVRLQQLVQGFPVIGAELLVNLDRDRNVLSVSGETLHANDVNTTPLLTPTTAVQTALGITAKTHGASAASLVTTTPELWIYSPRIIGPDAGPAALVWRMDVTPAALAPIRELVLVDARRGGVLLHFNQTETARNRMTYTASNGTILPGALVCNEANPCTTEAHASAAHTYAGDTYDFYLANHGRDSINGAGMTITSTVHYSSNYSNAFWDGDLLQLVYGDAAGFPLADDVVAHELTHGVTQFTSNLFYYYQSGAINESFSDVWGEFVDLLNSKGNDTPAVRWLLGEDISGIGSIRNMQNPPQYGDPDRMTSPLYQTTFADNGGVHSNSGLNNKAAFLLADGGSFNGQAITAIGIAKAAKIYYEVQTRLLTSGADYADLYYALVQGCNNLVGTSGITAADCQEVREAAIATEMNLQPIADFNLDAPLCAIGRAPSSTLFFDNIEAANANFAFSAVVGTNRWGRVTGYARSGVVSLYGNDVPGVPTDTSAALANGVVLPANAFLHFSHAFGFEFETASPNRNFDGGVLEYTTNNGAAWIDAGSLIEAPGGYNGAIATGFQNPLASRTAFVNESRGYRAVRVNLASLAGRSVRFRWRMGLDESISYLGWVVDDVRIYTCHGAPGDYDGDGKSDITIFRPSTGVWHTLRSSTGTAAAVAWGNAADRPFLGDYDGDLRADVTVFRPSNGTWYVIPSTTGVGFGVQWGNSADITVPGYYDTDVRTDIAIFRPSSGTWFVVPSTTGAAYSFQWGNSADIPVPGDYDGDARTDTAVFRPSTGEWHVVRSSTGTPTAVQWGNSADTPVGADYDGDGKTDTAVFRPSNGTWYVVPSTTGAAYGVQWGNSADIPTPADYNGDGKTDIAVFRPSNGTWYVLPSTGAAYAVQWGNGADIPIFRRP